MTAGHSSAYTENRRDEIKQLELNLLPHLLKGIWDLNLISISPFQALYKTSFYGYWDIIGNSEKSHTRAVRIVKDRLAGENWLLYSI